MSDNYYAKELTEIANKINDKKTTKMTELVNDVIDNYIMPELQKKAYKGSYYTTVDIKKPSTMSPLYFDKIVNTLTDYGYTVEMCKFGQNEANLIIEWKPKE